VLGDLRRASVDDPVLHLAVTPGTRPSPT
jgi:hypothetical protein